MVVWGSAAFISLMIGYSCLLSFKKRLLCLRRKNDKNPSHNVLQYTSLLGLMVPGTAPKQATGGAVVARGVVFRGAEHVGSGV